MTALVDPTLNLACAILHRAVVEWQALEPVYEVAVKSKDGAGIDTLTGRRRELLKFFSSAWCELLFDIAGMDYECCLQKLGVLKLVL